MYMDDMFSGDVAFDQDLSYWCVADNFDAEPSGFDTSTSSDWTDAEKPNWTADSCPVRTDADGDGYRAGSCDDDCDDTDATVYPGADEFNSDGIDNDCDGIDDIDADGDGYGTAADCDDTNAAINPAAIEDYYDGVDNDCNGVIDDGPADPTFYEDEGDSDAEVELLGEPNGFFLLNTY
jgi:hypothetical protein